MPDKVAGLLVDSTLIPDESDNDVPHFDGNYAYYDNNHDDGYDYEHGDGW